MRVHELAKKLDHTNKEILAVLEELGVEGKSHTSSIEEDLVHKIEKKLKKPVHPTKTAVKEPVAKEPVAVKKKPEPQEAKVAPKKKGVAGVKEAVAKEVPVKETPAPEKKKVEPVHRKHIPPPAEGETKAPVFTAPEVESRTKSPLLPFCLLLQNLKLRSL